MFSRKFFFADGLENYFRGNLISRIAPIFRQIAKISYRESFQ